MRKRQTQQASSAQDGRDRLNAKFEPRSAQAACSACGGDSKGFFEASPETVAQLVCNVAAPARCSKPVIAAERADCLGVGVGVGFKLSLVSGVSNRVLSWALRRVSRD